MGRAQLRRILRNAIGEKFLKQSLIYEPKDMTSTPASVSESDDDLWLMEVLAAGDNIVANFEDEHSIMERSRVQTHNGIQGETGPKVRETDEWAKMTKKMRLDQVSAPSWSLEDACEMTGVPVSDGFPILRPASDRYL